MTLTKIDARIISREARKDFAQIQRTVADYNEMVEDCREQGFRPQYCIHGTNQWTDYDNICNGCENGDLPQYMTYSDVLRDTLDDYRRTMDNFKKKAPLLQEASQNLIKAGLKDLAITTIEKGLDELKGRFRF